MKAENISIHTADETYTGGIAKIYTEVIDEPENVRSDEIKEYIRHFIEGNGSKVFILTRGVSIIGILMAKVKKSDMPYGGQTAAFIGETIVSRNFRGQGYGRILLRHAQSWFKKENADYVVRWVFPLPE